MLHIHLRDLVWDSCAGQERLNHCELDSSLSLLSKMTSRRQLPPTMAVVQPSVSVRVRVRTFFVADAESGEEEWEFHELRVATVEVPVGCCC